MHLTPAELTQRAGKGGAPAMPPKLSDTERDAPEWVGKLHKRLPRHQEPPDPDWFLEQEVEPWRRWYAAEQTMLKDRSGGHTMKMWEALDKIRRDLGTARACWMPQKWTTMVQGRPVQVDYVLAYPGTLWRSRTPAKQT